MNPEILLTPLVLISTVLFVAWPLLKEGKIVKAEESILQSAFDEKEALIAGLKDLEMDFRMGKLSEEDYNSSRSDLESRALKAVEQVESLQNKVKK